MIEEPTDIGRRIYDLRIEHDVQQGELAHAVHLHQSVLNRIEKGTRPARDAEIRAIARYFHVTSDFLLGLPPAAPCADSASVLSFPVSSEERDLIQTYRGLDDRGRRAVQTALRSEANYLEASRAQKNA